MATTIAATTALKKLWFEHVTVFGDCSSFTKYTRIGRKRERARAEGKSHRCAFFASHIMCMTEMLRDIQNIKLHILIRLIHSFLNGVSEQTSCYRSSFCNRWHCLRANLRDMCSFLPLCVCFKHFRLFQFFCFFISFSMLSILSLSPLSLSHSLPASLLLLCFCYFCFYKWVSLCFIFVSGAPA